MRGRLDPLQPWLPPLLFRFLRRQAKRWLGRRSPASVREEDIGEISALMRSVGTYKGGPWDRWREAHMALPVWFRRGLDPWGPEYLAQQVRLWQLIAGVSRPYDPEVDEAEIYAADATDAIRRPAYFARRDAEAVISAGDHVLATGMLLKHANIAPGERALEYGAGFGQTALAMARLGVSVDTVDISANFCRWVQQQADFFQAPLQAHQGRFGINPRPGERYKLIWFYESFHHCLAFAQVVPQIEAHLADGGRIILAGEPIVEGENAAVPYPWGLRLDSETLAMVRHAHWFELGFSEAFLYELFARSGLVGRRIDCEPSLWGRLYVFERPPATAVSPVQSSLSSCASPSTTVR